MSSATRDLLRRIIDPVVTAEGLDLEDVELTQTGKRSQLRIVVDSDEGVDLEHCAEVSRLIARALDDSDAMGDDPYTLEVGSPGVSRPLTLPRHWSRAVGRLVRVRFHGSDRQAVTGRVVSAGKHAAVLEVDGANRDVAYDDVRKAKVQVEFRRDDDGEEE
ncbi:ribosome maturation factor RimP [Haloactinopolyspora alba]|uniref:Ribosome maturation factor RimP n=1 Tax=Haloactinopolyspora alba TaxID=648780 RepID=A0A2P8DV69_9ACTN|nr:ribosome maturation factor RimP [Haloactinopolyspora alba]PSL01138.1 ribosome maturation factor RimP [Haloactinopolyspora alba]